MDGAGGGAPGWNAEAAARPISARPPAVSRCPAPRATLPPAPRALRSGAGIAETFPCTRPGNPAGAAAQADPLPSPSPRPLLEPTAPGRLSVPLPELLALEGGGGEKIPPNYLFLWGWFLHKPVFYFKACLKKK